MSRSKPNLAYFFIIFEVLIDETTQWGILQWSFSDFLSPKATWTYLRVKLFNQLKQAWLTMIQSYIDHSCKYQLLCAIMITLCYHPMDGCLRFIMNNAIFLRMQIIFWPLFSFQVMDCLITSDRNRQVCGCIGHFDAKADTCLVALQVFYLVLQFLWTWDSSRRKWQVGRTQSVPGFPAYATH